MPKNLDELRTEVLALNLAERSELAAALLESLDSVVDDDVEAAWEAVIERRVGETERGAVVGIPWAEVRRELTLG